MSGDQEQPSGDRGSVIALAIGVMNVATYGFTILAAHRLGPRPYGALAAVMNVLIVVGVAQLALQATAARRVSTTPGDVSVIEAGVRALTRRTALALGVLLLLAAPLVNALLRLDSLTTSLLIGLTAVPMTLMGGLAGILQGERRWRPLAAVYVSAGVPRLLIGGALVLWRPDETTALVGVLLGALAPVVVGEIALAGRGRAAVAGLGDRHALLDLVRESAHHSHALLAFFALSNADIVMARNVLDPHDAGLYAGGLILAKTMLFLPQFVVVLAFPDLASSTARRRALRLSLSAVAGLGVVGTVAAWLLSGLALVFVGGSAYGDVQGRLWAFALLGTVLSMVQLIVYAMLARRATVSVLLIWAGLAAIVVGARASDSITALVTLVIAVDVVVLAALLLADRRSSVVE